MRFLSFGADSVQQKLHDSRLNKENPPIHLDGIRKILALSLGNYSVCISRILITSLELKASIYGKYAFWGIVLSILSFYIYMNYAYKDDRIYNILDDKLRENSTRGKRDFFVGLFLFFFTANRFRFRYSVFPE